MQRAAMFVSFVSSRITENVAKLAVHIFSKRGLIALQSSTEMNVLLALFAI